MPCNIVNPESNLESFDKVKIMVIQYFAYVSLSYYQLFYTYVLQIAWKSFCPSGDTPVLKAITCFFFFSTCSRKRFSNYQEKYRYYNKRVHHYATPCKCLINLYKLLTLVIFNDDGGETVSFLSARILISCCKLKLIM